jgi:hypothetical protein
VSNFLKIFVWIILNTAFAKNNVHDNSTVKLVIEKKSSLNIQGETNINRFQCDVTEYLKSDTLVYTKNDLTKKFDFIDSHLIININRFNCYNVFINDNFRNTLKADENPNLKIVFLTIDEFPNNCNNQAVNGIVDIELANVIKRTEIKYIVKALPGNRIEMNGSHIFSFSDFNLKAARAMGGLIRTKDDIRVNFQLFFKFI